MKDYVDTRFNSVETSTTLARESIDMRLEGMNEFRDQFNDLTTRLISRVEVEDKLQARLLSEEAYERRVQSLEQKIANFEGRLWAMGIGVSVLSAVLASAISIALHYLK